MPSMDLTPHQPSAAPLAERETHGMHSGHPFVVATWELLDHRTRALTIPVLGAPRGRYLAIEDAVGERLLALTRPITHIGRGLVCDLRLEDPHVSRRHAIVALRGGGVRILDDRSADGTFVNGRPVDVAHLADGDVVRVGRAVFRYVEVTSARAGASHRGARPLRRGWVATGSAPDRRRGALPSR
jgi:hypothetical protein